MVKRNDTVNVKDFNLVETSDLERVEVTEKGGHPMSGMAPSRVQQSDWKPLAKDLSIMNYGDQRVCTKQQQSSKCINSLAQRMRIPYAFRKVSSNTRVVCKDSVLSDSSNQPKERKNEMSVEGENSAHSLSLNQSYDVDTPSELWLHEGLGFGSKSYCVQEKYLTPENQGGGHRGVSKAKRRLLMQTTEGNEERIESGGARWVVRPHSSAPKDPNKQEDKSQQQTQAHAIQVRALEDEQRRRQLEQIQPPPPLQPSTSFPECCRPLVLAAVKGFLTRRLLRTERVAQLLRTIKDTQQFLQVFERQTPGRGEFCSRQDFLLQERVTLQLRSARYEVYGIFFCMSAGERMRLISWDRELVREREVRRQSRNTGRSKGTNSLSAATQKSLERKRGLMIQRRAAERQRRIATRPAQRSGLTDELPSKPKQGHFKANLQRLSKTTYSC
ncbi:uncharacterized protein LOC130113325 isoform X2 [Lampris incognitus]|uniref:uncharacterized protein LOC130113325 isoform X2 n=1 Tax=Lampris incognitus TaxID=2546036 RepID=UPI0024B4DFD5|nr:uncharacterized protein LOC130113325 isoform X2 [Lampris incognitus]